MYLGMPSAGEEVRILQEFLNQFIPTPPLLREDGIFGPKTKARVILFQQQAGLVPDGIVGPKTGQALVGRALAITISGSQAARRV